MSALSEKLSTGNGLLDTGLGGIFGYLANNREDNPYGMFYANSNWKGNGIGDTSLGYAKNPYHRDYQNDAHGLSALLHGQRGGNPFGGVLGKLSGLFNRNRQQDSYYSPIGYEANNYINDIPSYSNLYNTINNEVMY